MNNEEIMVSICCITYNHGKYIKDALDGFLMQKTNFKYEIIVHDDASTDDTQDIIREYEKKYPDIIKPIYQVENQYQQGKKTNLIAFNHAKGKYIALCEGDDYWSDENKLQLQVDYMENNEQCAFCFHDALILDMRTQKKIKWPWYIKKYLHKDGNYNAGELDLIGSIPTASYVFRKKYVENLPDWFQKCIVGDITLQLLITHNGYAHCIDKVMSVYRVGTGISAMDSVTKENKNVEKAIQYWKNIEWIYDQFNEFSNYKYDKELKITKKYIEKNILIAKEEFKTIIKEKEYRKLLGTKEKIKIFIKAYLPKICEKI